MKRFLSSLGPVCAVVGAQWGDEGKGKIVDLLAEHYDVIARAAGGANAGHTIVVDGKKHVFHLLPAGSLHAGKKIVLGAGMVIHLPTLLTEIRTLEEAGIEVRNRLFISSAAHIVFEYHKAIDAMVEERRAKSGTGIGTTKRGIGPAYTDKAAREGIRMECLRWKESELRDALAGRAKAIEQSHGLAVDVMQELTSVESARVLLSASLIPDLSAFFGRVLGKETILLEGAQGTLLDIDHGTYPFVTSSATTVAGALQGLGIPPRALTSSIGVAKAYCTRVGAGTFPTEVRGEAGDRIRERGGEYGATTGRPRRCGWLSIPDLRRAARVNGFTCWNITKLDVLDEEEVIPVATDVTADGTPVYRECAGWKTGTAGITDFERLPVAARDFIRLIEEEIGIPVSAIGTGQKREEMILR